MDLTAKNVIDVYDACLYKKDESRENMLMIQGIVETHRFDFNPVRLKENEEKIHQLLLQLPQEFQKSKGFGGSFLNACMDKDGNQWADLHLTMEILFMLGIATGKAKYIVQRDLWKALPGGMPFFMVEDPKEE